MRSWRCLWLSLEMRTDVDSNDSTQRCTAQPSAAQQCGSNKKHQLRHLALVVSEPLAVPPFCCLLCVDVEAGEYAGLVATKANLLASTLAIYVAAHILVRRERGIIRDIMAMRMNAT